MSEDRETVAVFTRSWKSLRPGSVYTDEQFTDWLYPITEDDLRGRDVLERLPLYAYSHWIARREIGFFRHEAFAHKVAPRTRYSRKANTEQWLANADRLVPERMYIIIRNENWWKFEGRVACV